MGLGQLGPGSAYFLGASGETHHIQTNDRGERNGQHSDKARRVFYLCCSVIFALLQDHASFLFCHMLYLCCSMIFVLQDDHATSYLFATMLHACCGVISALQKAHGIFQVCRCQGDREADVEKAPTRAHAECKYTLTQTNWTQTLTRSQVCFIFLCIDY